MTAPILGQIEIGDRFGELFVEWPHRVGPAGAEVWRLRCACGASVVRSAARLLRGQRVGGQCCFECFLELRRGHLADLRQRVADAFDLYGTLWSAAALLRLQELIRKDLESEGIELRERLRLRQVPISVSIDTEAFDGAGRELDFQRRTFAVRRTQQRAAYLFPVRVSRAFFPLRCASCRKGSRFGFACAQCIGFACRSCVRDQAHRHHDTDLDVAPVAALEAVLKRRQRKSLTSVAERPGRAPFGQPIGVTS